MNEKARQFYQRKKAKERVLAQWRGVDLTPMERARQDNFKEAGPLVSKILKQMGLNDRKQSEAEIMRVWKETVDPNVARHAQPTGLRQGTLFVTVDNNVWLAELVRYRRFEILRRLQSSFGKSMIQRISFRVG